MNYIFDEQSCVVYSTQRVLNNTIEELQKVEIYSGPCQYYMGTSSNDSTTDLAEATDVLKVQVLITGYINGIKRRDLVDISDSNGDLYGTYVVNTVEKQPSIAGRTQNTRLICEPTDRDA